MKKDNINSQISSPYHKMNQEYQPQIKKSSNIHQETQNQQNKKQQKKNSPLVQIRACTA